jgi:acetyl/propionyl-CoA carboxylase alpha subunit
LRLFESLMADDRFRAGDLHTGFLDEFMSRSQARKADQEALLASILAAAHTEAETPQMVPEAASTPGGWRTESRRGLLR